MTDLLAGWAPAERVRRRVVLPEWLDRQVSDLAEKKHETPTSFLTTALADAVSAWATTPQTCQVQLTRYLGHATNGVPERRVRRTLMLEPRVNDALNACAYSIKTELSELTTAILRELLAGGGAGTRDPASSDRSSSNGSHAR